MKFKCEMPKIKLTHKVRKMAVMADKMLLQEDSYSLELHFSPKQFVRKLKVLWESTVTQLAGKLQAFVDMSLPSMAFG